MGYEGQDFSDIAGGVSPAFIEALYTRFKASPDSVEPGWRGFFEGLEGGDASGENHSVHGDLLADKEALELVRSYYAIPENQRRRLFELARVLSDVA